MEGSEGQVGGHVFMQLVRGEKKKKKQSFLPRASVGFFLCGLGWLVGPPKYGLRCRIRQPAYATRPLYQASSLL